MTKISDIEKDGMVKTLSDYHTTGESGNDSTFLNMSKCERYAVGKQWDKEVL